MYADAPPVDESPAPEPAPAPAQAAPVMVELAGTVGYATAPIRGGTNPFGAGLGVRAGLEFAGVYLGVSILDFLGGTDVDVSYRALLLGLEAGYGFRFPAFAGASWLLRPHVTFGDARVYYTDPALAVDVVTTASGSSQASDTLTVDNVFVQPGVTLELTTSAFLVGAEGGLLVLPGIAYGGADATTWLSYTAQLDAGFRF